MIESKRLATGLVTSWVTRSTGPKMAAPAFRAGDAPPSRKSTVISATAMISENAEDQAYTPGVVHCDSSSVAAAGRRPVGASRRVSA